MERCPFIDALLVAFKMVMFNSYTGYTYIYILVGGFNPLKNISQLG